MTTAQRWRLVLMSAAVITVTAPAADRADWDVTAAPVRFAPAPAAPDQWPLRTGDTVRVDTDSAADAAATWERWTASPAADPPTASHPSPPAVTIDGYRFRGDERTGQQSTAAATWREAPASLPPAWRYDAAGAPYRFRHDPRFDHRPAPALPGYRFRPQ